MTNRIHPLDGLRGVAVLMVVAGHVAQNAAGIPAELRPWLMGMANASAGVRLFFVLSGYLITSLLLSEHRRTGRIALAAFYVRRVRRIFPAFYVYLLAVVILGVVVPIGLNGEAITSAATFTWNYAFLWVEVGHRAYWYLGHLWTLALEQQFYLLWPAVLLIAGWRRGLSLALLLIIWCPLARLASYLLFPEQRGFLGMMLHTGIDSIMAGCAAALLMANAGWRARIERHGTPAIVVLSLWLFVASPVCALIFRGFPLAVGYTLDALAAAGLVCVVHFGAPSGWRSLLGSRPLRLIGLISYSLYLWQQMALSPALLISPTHVALAVMGAFAAATLSYFLVERPFLRSSVAHASNPKVQPVAHER